MYGFEFPPLAERLARFAEQLELIHREWTEEGFDFAGAHYRVVGARALPRPVQRPHPNLIVGGTAKRGTAEPAARFADEYNSVGASPAECRARRARLDDACRRAGRDPGTLVFSLMTECVLGRDERDLEERIRSVAARAGADPETFASDRRERSIIGTLGDVRARLAEYEGAGVQRVFLQHLDHADLDAIALMGELA
jgi:alkanesulfonate monooxygenase